MLEGSPPCLWRGQQHFLPSGLPQPNGLAGPRGAAGLGTPQTGDPPRPGSRWAVLHAVPAQAEGSEVSRGLVTGSMTTVTAPGPRVTLKPHLHVSQSTVRTNAKTSPKQGPRGVAHLGSGRPGRRAFHPHSSDWSSGSWTLSGPYGGPWKSGPWSGRKGDAAWTEEDLNAARDVPPG